MPDTETHTLTCPQCQQPTLIITISTEHDPLGDGYCQVEGNAEQQCDCVLTEDEVQAVLAGIRAGLEVENAHRHEER